MKPDKFTHPTSGWMGSLSVTTVRMPVATVGIPVTIVRMPVATVGIPVTIVRMPVVVILYF